MNQTIWKPVRIDQIGKVITGNTPPKKIPDYYGNNYTWIKPTDIEIDQRYVANTEEKYSEKAYEKYKTCLLPPFTTCVVTIGTVGEKICLTNEPCFTNQSINAIIPNTKEFDPVFVYYLLKSNLHIVSQRNPGTASGRHHVSKSNFSSIKLEVPDFNSQKIISTIISKYDDLIENNYKRIKILEKMIHLVYTEWFVNFKFPNYQKTKFHNSEFGKIPEGWTIKKICEIVKISKGISYKSENLVVDGKIAFVTLKCIQRGGGFRYSGIKRFEGEFKEIHTVKPGDIVIAVTDMTQERNIVARAARIPNLNEEQIIISMDLVKITPVDNLDKNWLYSFFNHSTFGSEMKEFANGVNVLHLKSESMEQFRFIMPDELTIKLYSEFVSKIYDFIDNLHLRNQYLKRIREHLETKLILSKPNISDLKKLILEENNE